VVVITLFSFTSESFHHLSYTSSPSVDSLPSHSIPITSCKHLVASPPLALAPVCLAAKILSATAEVASRTAQSVSALLVHNGSARLALA
jgi:hypothetical protein